jgi:hypothetical protein
MLGRMTGDRVGEDEDRTKSEWQAGRLCVCRRINTVRGERGQAA